MNGASTNGGALVEFDNVVLRYRKDLAPALRGLSATFAPGERVGVCGRTGAGKSTIAVALFRLRELAGARRPTGSKHKRKPLAFFR